MIKMALIFCFIFHFFCVAQNKSTVKKLIEAKWELDGGEFNRESEYLKKIKKESYEFKSDGVFINETEYLDSVKIIIQGKYKIKKKGKKLKLRNKRLKIFPPNRYVSWNKKSIITISSIDEQELIFINKSNKAIYFKKIK